MNCPHCGRAHEVHQGSRRDSTPPEPGDVSICWGCAGLAIFTPFGLRLPTDEERDAIEADQDVRTARHAMAESYTPDQAAALRWGET